MSHIGRSPKISFDGLAWLTQPYQLLRDRWKAEGDVFEMDLGRHGRYSVLADPLDVRNVFTADPKVMYAGQGNAVLKAFLGAGSLLLLEGDRHREERRLLQPAFHGRRLASHARSIGDVAARHAARLAPGEVVSMQQVLQSLTLDLIVGIVFGDLEAERGEQLSTRLASFLDDPKFNLASMDELDAAGGASPTWIRFRATLEDIRGMLGEELVRRRRAPDSEADDVLGMLVAARYEDGTPMSDETIVDELLTMVVTGYETTATALAWALYFTHRDPEVLGELRARCATLAPLDAAKDPWIQSLVREVLRLHPVIPIVARRVMQTVQLGSRTIEEGTIVAPSIYLVHHRPELYPDPDTFRPSRFLERDYASHEYLPFGGGARRCIGMGLAWLEIAIALVAFVKTLDLELVEPELVKPRRRSVTVAPSRGTPMRVLRSRGEGAAPHVR